MPATPEQIAALEIETSQFESLVPEYTEYQTDENADAMFLYISNELKQTVTCASLIAAFHVLRKMGKLTKAPPSEDPAVVEAREEEAKREAKTARLLAEQNANRPLTHISHTDMADGDAEAQKESQANAKKVFENLEKLRKKIMGATPPIVYFEGGPNSGKVNWSATERARLAAGFNKDGSPRD
jgi:hypothetical protein